MTHSVVSNSAEATQRLGQLWGREAQPGWIVGLRGDLGAGKTQFVKGLVAGIGQGGTVTSPTFTLIHEYSGGRLPVYHFDFLRLEDQPAAERLGLEEYLFGDGVSVIEWADRFPELIPDDARWISFETKSETMRAITTK